MRFPMKPSMFDAISNETFDVRCDSVADLEIWKGGFKVVGVSHKAAEGSRQRRITRAAEQPKCVIKI